MCISSQITQSVLTCWWNVLCLCQQRTPMHTGHFECTLHTIKQCALNCMHKTIDHCPLLFLSPYCSCYFLPNVQNLWAANICAILNWILQCLFIWNFNSLKQMKCSPVFPVCSIILVLLFCVIFCHHHPFWTGCIKWIEIENFNNSNMTQQRGHKII